MSGRTGTVQTKKIQDIQFSAYYIPTLKGIFALGVEIRSERHFCDEK